MNNVSILLVEDDPNLRFLLDENLRGMGFSVRMATTGTEALEMVQNESFDLCIFDVMLPEIDGFSVAAVLNRKAPQVPFIFLTARDEETDRIQGFKIGADDYIVKPFSLRELHYRILVVLRRMNPGFSLPQKAAKYEIGSLSFNSLSRELVIKDTKRKLSQREAMLLHILLQTPGKYVQRTDILNFVWGNDNYFTSKSMDVYITRIRKILKDDPSLEIENLYGNGFRIKHTEEQEG